MDIGSALLAISPLGCLSYGVSSKIVQDDVYVATSEDIKMRRNKMEVVAEYAPDDEVMLHDGSRSGHNNKPPTEIIPYNTVSRAKSFQSQHESIFSYETEKCTHDAPHDNRSFNAQHVHGVLMESRRKNGSGPNVDIQSDRGSAFTHTTVDTTSTNNWPSNNGGGATDATPRARAVKGTIRPGPRTYQVDFAIENNPPLSTASTYPGEMGLNNNWKSDDDYHHPSQKQYMYDNSRKFEMESRQQGVPRENEYIEHIKKISEENSSLKMSLMSSDGLDEQLKNLSDHYEYQTKLLKDKLFSLQIVGRRSDETNSLISLLDVDDDSKSIDDISKSIGDLLKRNSNMERELKSLKEENKRLAKETDDTSHRNTILQDELEKIKSENDCYQDKIEEVTTLFISLQSSAAKVKKDHVDETSQLTNELESTKKKLSSLEKQIHKTSGKNRLTESTYRQEIQSRDDEITTLKTKLDELERSNKDYESRFDALHRALGAMQTSSAEQRALLRKAVRDAESSTEEVLRNDLPSVVYVDVIDEDFVDAK